MTKVALKKESKSQYIVESYALVQDADSSLLNLNPVLIKYGYEFVCITINEFENRFSHVVGLKKGFKSKSIARLEPMGIEVSSEFMRAFDQIYGAAFYIQLMGKNEIVLLKKIEDHVQVVVNGAIDSNEQFSVLAELQRFTNSLSTQLRLLKNGRLYISRLFQITSKDRFVVSSLSGTPPRTYHGGYSLTPKEIREFEKTFVAEFKPNSLTTLAIKNYNLTYDITDFKVQYTILMTCLESLFNEGRDQITHTISRHLSLIISTNKEEFQRNYERIKKLYGFRSAIVHGQTDKKEGDLMLKTTELSDLVRQAIKYCQKTDFNRGQLFKYLNAKGFES